MPQIFQTRIRLVLSLMVFLLGGTLRHAYSQTSNTHRDKHGNLLIPEIDSLTGGVKQIRGLTVNITDYGLTKDSLNKTSVEVFGKRLFDDYQSITNIPSSQLIVKSVRKKKESWFVSYDQVKNGIPVENTSIGFKIEPNGDVVNFCAMAYARIQCSTIPSITSEQIKEIARADLGVSQIEFTRQPLLAIYPLHIKSSFRYSLIWKVYCAAFNPYGTYEYEIDAHTGSILQKDKTSHELQEQ